MAAITLTFLASCGRGQDSAIPSPTPPTPTRNLLLISIDSLRADHIASYGYDRVTSPNIDRLAEQGVLFETMVADSSWTLPTHLTMMTGLSSWAHGVLTDTQRLGDGVETLAERLRQRGYHTVGFASGPYLHPVFGFSRGFDRYEVVGESVYDRAGVTLERIADSEGLRDELERVEDRARESRTSRVLADKVENAVARSVGKPFFVFVHMFDVHFDYVAPESYWRRFNPSYEGELTDVDFLDDPRVHPGMEPAELDQLIALYDGEIAWTDHHLGRILEILERYGVADDTLVVVTADHGEEFFDHGAKGHRHTLYDEQLLVPFVMRLPGVLPSGKKIRMQSRTIDIAPTVLDLLGLDSELGAGGRSLAPYALGTLPEEDLPAMSFLYVNNLLVRTLRTPEAKIEVTVPVEMLSSGYEGRVLDYDLVADPSERTALSDPESEAELRRLFDEQFGREDEARQATRSGLRIEIPAMLRSALEELGYSEPDSG